MIKFGRPHIPRTRSWLGRLARLTGSWVGIACLVGHPDKSGARRPGRGSTRPMWSGTLEEGDTMSTQRKQPRQLKPKPGDSQSLTASGPAHASEPPPHRITARRGDGLVMHLEIPESVIQANRRRSVRQP